MFIKLDIKYLAKNLTKVGRKNTKTNYYCLYKLLRNALHPSIKHTTYKKVTLPFRLISDAVIPNIFGLFSHFL